MLTVRPATADDVSILLGFVRELAEYEREPDSVEATEDDLRRFGFSDERPFFEAHIAEWDGEPVGFALHFYIYSTWTGKPSLYLEDLFVQPPFRDKGIGKALLVFLARVAVERGCSRYQWQALDWNRPAIEFYESLGAHATPEWVSFRVEGEGIERLAQMRTVLDR
jgi:GNAT superfamily N-acetyltransferase